MDIFDYLSKEIDLHGLNSFIVQNADKQNSFDVTIWEDDFRLCFTMLPSRKALSIVADELAADFNHKLKAHRQMGLEL